MTGEIRTRPTREELEASLVDGAIAGMVATPREGNLAHIRRFLAAERQFDFGVRLERDWTYDEVFALMVERAGLNPDPEFSHGVDTIGVRQCADALERMRAVVSEVASAGGRILFATGHPAGMLPVHMELAAWARSLGAQLVEDDVDVPVGEAAAEVTRGEVIGGDVRRIAGVWVWHQHGGVPHTHYAEPMAALLCALREKGSPWPDLVVADHGWAGCAGSQGVRTVGFADCNDPALFVAEAQGQVEVCVPLDDNVRPDLYRTLIDYMTL